MKRTLLFILILILPLGAKAQSVSLSGTITDSPDSQVWANGKITFTFSGAVGISYTWTGGTLNPNQPITANLNGSGAYSASIPDNNAITPNGSQWKVTVCPQMQNVGCNITYQTITAANTTLNLSPPSPRINVSLIPAAIPTVQAYANSEIVGGWLGFSYYNVISSALQGCTNISSTGCTTWSSIGGGFISGQANNVIPKGTTATTITQQSSCTDNGTTFSCTEPLSSGGAITSGTGCTAVAPTAVGGYCMTQGTSAGYTPTAGFTYFRADSATNKLVCSQNGAAEVACVGGSPTFPVNIQTTNYQVVAADFSSCKLIVTNSTSSLTVTLVASGSQPATGQCVQIENENTGTVTVARSGQNIDGATTSIILGNGQGLIVVSDGTNYFTNRGIAGIGCTSSCNWYPYWGSSPVAVNTNQGISNANNPGLIRFSTTVTNSVTKISFNVVTASAATTGDFGIYGNCTTTCTLLVHTGSVSTAATGVQTITVSTVSLPPATYYLGWCDSSSTPQFAAIQQGNSANNDQLVNPIANTAGFNGTDACTAGVLPSIFTITNIVNSTSVNGMPVITVSN